MLISVIRILDKMFKVEVLSCKLCIQHIETLKSTTSVPIYKTLLLKSRELRKWIFVLKLFIMTIVFTILSLREIISLCFQYVIYC